MIDDPNAEPVQPDEDATDAFSTDELDRLYQQAVEALDALDWIDELPVVGESGAEADHDAAPSEASGGEFPKLHDASVDDEASPAGEAAASEPTLEDADTRQLRVDQPVPLPTTAADERAASPDLLRPRVTPRQILEAALFVGGVSLTTRKLIGLLRGDFTPEFVEAAVQDLNTQYAAESRPYEIRFGEGGYRLCLRDEFERVRSRVFGLGPKEVKLTQEALEVLALVAYQQPISREAIEKLGKQNAGSILRQLLRRELVTIERESGAKTEVKYRTTPRFLQVFGLGDLDELPQAEELDLK